PVRRGGREVAPRRARRQRPRALLGPLGGSLVLAGEEAFAAEVREWLAANLEPPPAFTSIDEEIAWGRRWQARLAEARWVGIHWPREYGGRGAPPLQVAIFNTEYARARAPQPVNRVGINLAGPTLLAHGTEE